MKKTFAILSLVAFAAISLSSCKKDYTCACKFPATSTSIDVQILDAKKSDATEACDKAQTTYKIADAQATCELK